MSGRAIIKEMKSAGKREGLTNESVEEGSAKERISKGRVIEIEMHQRGTKS